MKILVIEDEPKAAEYLRQGLTESGYTIEVAHNGTDGLHADSIAFQLTEVRDGLNHQRILEREAARVERSLFSIRR